MDAFYATYPRYEYTIAALQLTLAMLGLGATLTVNDFLEVFRHPRSFSVGFLIQLGIVPLVALALCSLVDIDPGLAVGVSLIASIPGGSISNIFTYLGKGNIPLSVSLTGVVTLCCLGTTPLILGLLAAGYLPDTFEMPVYHVIRDITLFLLLPLSAGMGIYRLFPKHRERFSKIAIRTSLLLIVVMVVGSLGSGRIEVDAYGFQGPVFIIGFSVAIYFIAVGLTQALRFPEADTIAISIEVVIRNTNLALLLQATLFPVTAGADPALSSAVLFVVLFYGGTGVVFGTIVVVSARGYLKWIERRRN
jgi:BASS family bile acid:Na+ symporter